MDSTTRRLFLSRSAAFAAAAALGCRTASASGTRDPGLAGAEAGDEREDFLAAVSSGDEGRVRELLSKAPALCDAADDAGRSALVLACLAGHSGVAGILREAGATVGLIEAVMIPDWERAEELAMADPAALDRWYPVGGTALYAAARAGSDQLWRLQALGADVDGNPHGKDGVTPAFGAIEARRRVDAFHGATDLLSNGGHVNAPQRGGDTLLHAGARRGDPNLVRYLLRRGADSAARDARGESALDQAERLGHAEVAEVLRHPERVARDDMAMRYAFDANGEPVVWPDLSPFSQAEMGAVAGSSHTDFAGVRARVDGDARLSFSRSTQNELAVEACAHVGSRDITRYHLERGVPQSVATSISVGDLARARALLTLHPGAIHERGPHDFALFWYAAIGGGSIEAAELLLEFGADLDQESLGTTALHWCALRGHLDLARFLVEMGAGIDAVGYKFDRDGQTPLQLAQARSQPEAARLLRDLGASM